MIECEVVYTEKQIEGAKEFVEALSVLINLFTRAQEETKQPFGIWAEGDLGLADIMAAPCASFERQSGIP